MMSVHFDTKENAGAPSAAAEDRYSKLLEWQKERDRKREEERIKKTYGKTLRVVVYVHVCLQSYHDVPVVSFAGSLV